VATHHILKLLKAEFSHDPTNFLSEKEEVIYHILGFSGKLLTENRVLARKRVKINVLLEFLTCPHTLVSFWRPVIHALFSPIQVE